MLSLAVLTSICLFSNIVYCRPYTTYFSLPCPFTQPCTDPFNYRASNQVCPPTCNPCVPNSCIPSNIYNPCIPGNPYNPCIPSNLYNPCIPGNSGNPCNPYIPSNHNPCNPGNPCIPYNPYNPYNPCNPSNFCKPCPSPSEDDKKKKDDDNKEDDKKFSCTRMAQPPMDMNNYMPEAPNAPNAPKDMTRSRKPPGLLTSLFSIPGAIADSVLSGEISL